MEWLFWGSLVLIVYTYAGYPLLLSVVATLFKPRRGTGRDSPGPSVSVVLVVHNEEKKVLPRIENLLQTDYEGPLEVLVVCDRCDDNTLAAVAGVDAGQGVGVVELGGGKRGKAAGLNQGVAMSKGELVVFADVRQRFERDTIPLLIAPFADGKVGAVSGSLGIEPSAEVAGEGMDVYWRLEKLIREKESDIGSSIGCTGAVYAVRAEVYEAIPEDTILDDVVIPMKIALAGYRVLFEANARAYDPQPLDRESERRRKVRTLAGNWQMLFRYPSWLLPWKNRLAWQLVSHKYMRLLGPVFLLAALASNLILLGESRLYGLTLSWQVLCYGVGLVGMFEIRFPWKWVSLLVKISSGFLFLQSLCVVAFLRWMRGAGRGGGW